MGFMALIPLYFRTRPRSWKFPDQSKTLPLAIRLSEEVRSFSEVD